MHSGFRSGLSGVRELGCADSPLESVTMASACLESFVQITVITPQEPSSVVYVEVDAEPIVCQCHEHDSEFLNRKVISGLWLGVWKSLQQVCCFLILIDGL
jgi:hypothetical protein